MILKNTFKKFVALSLSLMTFGAAFKTYAISPELNTALKQNHTSSITDIIDKNPFTILEYLNEQVRKLESLGQGRIIITDEAKYKIHPLILAIFIEEINNILHKYPNITKAFLETIQERGGTAFYITASSESKDDGREAFTAKYAYEDNPVLTLNELVFGNSVSIEKFASRLNYNIQQEMHPQVDKNIRTLIASNITHEIGHLIEYFVIFERFKEAVVKNGEKINEHDPLTAYIYQLHSADEASTIRRTISRGTTPAKISTYAETNDKEWFAELFCAAMCDHNLKFGPIFKVEPIELLKYRMLEWLDIIEKMYATK